MLRARPFVARLPSPFGAVLLYETHKRGEHHYDCYFYGFEFVAQECRNAASPKQDDNQTFLNCPRKTSHGETPQVDCSSFSPY